MSLSAIPWLFVPLLVVVYPDPELPTELEELEVDPELEVFLDMLNFFL